RLPRAKETGRDLLGSLKLRMRAHLVHEKGDVLTHFPRRHDHRQIDRLATQDGLSFSGWSDLFRTPTRILAVARYSAIPDQFAELVAAHRIRDQMNTLVVRLIDHVVSAPRIENPALARAHVDFAFSADEANARFGHDRNMDACTC